MKVEKLWRLDKTYSPIVPHGEAGAGPPHQPLATGWQVVQCGEVYPTRLPREEQKGNVTIFNTVNT